MSHHLSLLKNNSENSNSMPHHISPLKTNSKIQGNYIISRHISPLKNNSKNSKKIYYNSLRVINYEFSKHVSMLHHLMSYYLFSLKNNFKNF
jgi:hypothetical protein